MAEHGGYRQPSHPAPVSGPGAHSARTDRGPKQYDITGGSYGSGQEFQAQQSAAPLAAQNTQQAPPEPMPTPLDAPSDSPETPVTAGADAGAGPSMAEIGLENNNDAELKARLGPLLPVFMRMADSDSATSAFKEQVRQLIARIS